MSTSEPIYRHIHVDAYSHAHVNTLHSYAEHTAHRCIYTHDLEFCNQVYKINL